MQVFRTRALRSSHAVSLDEDCIVLPEYNSWVQNFHQEVDIISNSHLHMIKYSFIDIHLIHNIIISIFPPLHTRT